MIWTILVTGAATLYQVDQSRRIALDMDGERQKRKFSALCAILDDGYEQCKRLEGEFEDEDAPFGNLSFILTFDVRAFEDAIANIEKISLTELESYDAVRAISRFRNKLISIKRYAEYAKDKNRDRGDADDYQIKRYVTGLIAEAEAEYSKAVTALRGEVLTEISPFCY